MAVLKYKINLKVVRDRYLILEDEPSWDKEVTPEVKEALEKGKLFLPDKFEAWAKKSPDTGTIVSSGPDVKEKLKPGTKVRFGKFAGQRFEYKGLKLQIINERDLHAIETEKSHITVTVED